MTLTADARSQDTRRPTSDTSVAPHLYEKLTTLMRRVFRNDKLVATEELTAHGVPGWDSLGHARFLVEVERAFSVRFLATEISSLETVGHLARLIERKQHASKRSEP